MHNHHHDHGNGPSLDQRSRKHEKAHQSCSTRLLTVVGRCTDVVQCWAPDLALRAAVRPMATALILLLVPIKANKDILVERLKTMEFFQRIARR